MMVRALALLAVAGLWVLFVGGVRRDEMWVGGGVLLLAGAFLSKVWQTETLRLDFQGRELAQAWRVPWSVVSGVCAMIAVLAGDVFGRRRADSLFRVSGFRRARTEARFAARRVLATFYTTMAPDIIVIGIDAEQGRMLFHQLRRAEIPTMTQALGAEPETGAR